MLALFAVSTIGQSLIVLFVRSFYAEGKTARPLVINAISAAIIVIAGYSLDKAFFAFPMFRYFLESLMKVDGQVGTSVLVLSLAFTFGVIINTILHWWTYEKVYKGFTKPVFTTLFQSFAASVIMGYVAFQSLRLFALAFPLTKAWGIFMQGLCAGLVGLVALVIMLILLKNKELVQVWKTLHHKIWKVAVPPAEMEHI
jgi:peptidoglycan biosynthesis protein MviN/MurJ (putative lipid II flippase)